MEQKRSSYIIISIKLLVIIFVLQLQPLSTSSSLCRNFCGNIPINYPFGLADGCGAAQFRNMLNCSTGLFFKTPSGNYKVQSIDYTKHTISVYDPSMTTCSILQPLHDFIMSDIQYAVVPPSPDTVFLLLNCSVDSPVLNRYSSLCFNFTGHSCEEVYGSCNSLRAFRLLSNDTPPCCFTGYSTVKFMSMNILDCSHYTSFYDADSLKGVGPLDWSYGIRLSYSVPDSGCERCVKSGGTCGFDTETEGMLSLLRLREFHQTMCYYRCSDEVNPRKKPYKFSNQKLKELGLEFTPVKQCLYDTIKSLQDKGHLSLPKHSKDHTEPAAAACRIIHSS